MLPGDRVAARRVNITAPATTGAKTAASVPKSRPTTPVGRVNTLPVAEIAPDKRQPAASYRTRMGRVWMALPP
jgi:hypothetical protein